jgi:PAS domain S-box-containing protein
MAESNPDLKGKTENFEIKRLNSMLNGVMERVSDGIVAFDSEFNYTYVNSKGASLLGRTPEDLIGKNYWKEYPEARGTIFANKYLEAMNSQMPVEFEDNYLPWNRWFINRIFPSHEGITIFFADITEKKQAEVALMRSESKFKAVVENSTEGFMFLNPDGTIKFRSNSYSGINGYSSEEVIGKSGFSTIHPDDQEPIREAWELILARPGSSGTKEFRSKHKDGTWVWIESTIKNMLDVPHVQALVLSSRDISIRKKAAEELMRAKEIAEENERNYRYIFDNAREGFFRIKDGKTILINKAAAAIFGYATVEEALANMTDNPNQLWVNRIDRENISSKLKENSMHRNFEVNMRKRDGMEIWVSLNVRMVRDSDGNELYYEGFVQDVTERRKYEDELIASKVKAEVAKEKAEESDRLKTAFLQNMSHEIRTPMNAIMGFSDLLVNNFDNKAKLAQFTGIIKQRCNDLLTIITDILDIAYIESGQLTIKTEFFRIEDLFNDLREIFQKNAGENIVFKISLSTGVSNMIIGTDKGKLKQILINLLNNAFKFTKKGEIEGGCFMSDDKLVFYVSDTGIGIPQDKHEKIFERFYQIEPESTRLYGGNGLGLSIVKGLIDILEGKIWLESSPGKGSRFYFMINYKDGMNS